jgi:anti-sigma factor RsiW
VLTCRDAVDLLAAYVEGELDPFRTRALLRHLARCRDCEAYLDGYRKAIALGRAACAGEHEGFASRGDDVPEGLVRSILAARRGAAAAFWHLLAAVAASPLLFFYFGPDSLPF